MAMYNNDHNSYCNHHPCSKNKCVLWWSCPIRDASPQRKMRLSTTKHSQNIAEQSLYATQVSHAKTSISNTFTQFAASRETGELSNFSSLPKAEASGASYPSGSTLHFLISVQNFVLFESVNRKESCFLCKKDQKGVYFAFGTATILEGSRVEAQGCVEGGQGANTTKPEFRTVPTQNTIGSQGWETWKGLALGIRAVAHVLR